MHQPEPKKQRHHDQHPPGHDPSPAALSVSPLPSDGPPNPHQRTAVDVTTANTNPDPEPEPKLNIPIIVAIAIATAAVNTAPAPTLIHISVPVLGVHPRGRSQGWPRRHPRPQRQADVTLPIRTARVCCCLIIIPVLVRHGNGQHHVIISLPLPAIIASGMIRRRDRDTAAVTTRDGIGACACAWELVLVGILVLPSVVRAQLRGAATGVVVVKVMVMPQRLGAPGQGGFVPEEALRGAGVGVGEGGGAVFLGEGWGGW